MQNIYKNFVFDIIIAVLALAVGILMIPTFGIASHALNILLAITLAVYLVVFLFGKLRRTNGTVFVFTVIEFIVISAIVIGLIFQQFRLIAISGICQTIGLVMWLRGLVMALGMYISSIASKKPRRDIPRFFIALLLISVGAFLFAKPIISDAVLEWVLCISFFVYAIIFAALAFLFAPTKKASSKNS